MKTVKFTYYPEYGGYKCSEPGEGTGTYVLKTEADAEIQQVKADWVERCKKFRKKDADEHEAEIAALEHDCEFANGKMSEYAKQIDSLHERQRVLVEALKNLKENRKAYLALEAKLAACQENLNDMFNVGPVCLECQQWAERWDEVNNKLAALVEAAEEVVRISDRKHDAWDRLKDAIAAAKGTP